MPYVISCLGEAAKDALGELDLDERRVEGLRKLPTCQLGEIQFAETTAKAAGEKKRKPNIRSKFVGQCIKTRYAETKTPVPELMKECSGVWRELTQDQKDEFRAQMNREESQ